MENSPSSRSRALNYEAIKAGAGLYMQTHVGKLRSREREREISVVSGYSSVGLRIAGFLRVQAEHTHTRARAYACGVFNSHVMIIMSGVASLPVTWTLHSKKHTNRRGWRRAPRADEP